MGRPTIESSSAVSPFKSARSAARVPSGQLPPAMSASANSALLRLVGGQTTGPVTKEQQLPTLGKFSWIQLLSCSEISLASVLTKSPRIRISDHFQKKGSQRRKYRRTCWLNGDFRSSLSQRDPENAPPGRAGSPGLSPGQG
jgi:hypothetical protein